MNTILSLMQVATVLGISVQETKRLVRQRQLVPAIKEKGQWPKFDATTVYSYIKKVQS